MSRLISRIGRELAWYSCYAWHRGLATSFVPDTGAVRRALEAAGVPFERLKIPKDGFCKFLSDCEYPVFYHRGKGKIYIEKCLEHYLSLIMLEVERSDSYIDLASAGSPFPDYVRRTLGCRVLRNDLTYSPGISEDSKIGSDACHLPLPDQAITKATLHCSFEHFEGDADIEMIREFNRILSPGGRACIIPLYLHREYVGLTDPFVDRNGLAWDQEMRVIYSKNYGQRHGRFYDVARLQKRIVRHLQGLLILA